VWGGMKGHGGQEWMSVSSPYSMQPSRSR
jgi:hypothetical protein